MEAIVAAVLVFLAVGFVLVLDNLPEKPCEPPPEKFRVPQGPSVEAKAKETPKAEKSPGPWKNPKWNNRKWELNGQMVGTMTMYLCSPDRLKTPVGETGDVESLF